jgi:hypothetical protein
LIFSIWVVLGLKCVNEDLGLHGFVPSRAAFGESSGDYLTQALDILDRGLAFGLSLTLSPWVDILE